jgi:trimethylamine-N-oxide reductase (cytochrome c)
MVTGDTGDSPDSPIMLDFMKKVGKAKLVVIDPDYNDTMAKYGDTWIPIIPGTDSALAAAIAYVWISEGTYDKEFVATHTVGFDDESLPAGAPPNSSFKAYITGAMDGVAKTPEWAEKTCGVKARIIRALAREWASQPTMGGIRGSAHRQTYGHEWARYIVALTAMQGYGKPGVNCHGDPALPSAGNVFSSPSGFADLWKNPYPNSIGQFDNPLNRQIFTEAILNGTATWHGDELSADPEMAFKTMTWPSPGYSVIRAWYCSGHSHFSARVDANKTAKAYMSPNLEFIVTTSPWWGGTCIYSDIILPLCTPLEQSDINSGGRNVHKFVVMNDGIVEPLGESKSDFECGLAIAKKLGWEDKYSEGLTKESMLKAAFNKTKVGDVMSYEEFKKVGYIYNPSKYTPAWKGEVAQRWFYNKKGEEITGPESGFATPSGKVEFFSQLIFKHRGVNDPIIHPVPKYYPAFGGEKVDSQVAKTYPLRLLSSHIWFRMHGMYDQISLLRECYKVEDKDGYQHEPATISWADAEARGIKDGDIIRIFNDRGAVLAGAKVTKGLLPGVVKLHQGCWYDPADPSNPFLDKAGCCQALIHSKGQSPGWAEKIPDVTAWVQIEKYMEGSK